MAKQLLNPFERHLEKGVLGLAGLVLVGVVAKYLVTTPNRLELGGQLVYPVTIDEKVADHAELVRQSIRNRSATDEDFVPLLDEFVRSANPFVGGTLLAELPPGAPFAPQVPIIDPPGLKGEKAALVKVVRFGKPMLTAGRSTFEIDGNETALNWVTVSSVFDREAQIDLHLRTYGAKWRGVLFGPVEIQRRQRRPGGIWSDDDWRSVEAWTMAEVPPIPAIPLVEEDGQLLVTREDNVRVKRFLEAIRVSTTQLEYLRPVMPPRLNGSPWSFPIITTMLDVAKQDDAYLHPDDRPLEIPLLGRYPDMMEPEDDEEKTEEVLTLAEEIKRKFDRAKEFMETARTLRDDQPAIIAYNELEELIHKKGISQGDKVRAQRMQRDAEQLRKDIVFEKKGNRGVPNQPAESVRKVKRQPLPKQQVWVHDAQPGSVADGKTYQYRIRPVVHNALMGVPEKFEEPTDALKAFVRGEWSPPSDQITVEPSVEYFVTRADERKAVANVEVFQWFYGVWVSHGFKVGVGQAVAGDARAEIPDFEDPTQAFKPVIPFAAGATVVDIDFDRERRERRKERGGIRIMAPERTTAVVFVDADGGLHERFEVQDRRHPRRSAAKSRVWKPRRRSR